MRKIKILNKLYLFIGSITALATAVIMFNRTIKKFNNVDITNNDVYNYTIKKKLCKEKLDKTFLLSKSEINIFCGSFVLDLRNASIIPNAIINCDIYMGTCNIIVPKGYNIKFLGTTVLGNNNVNIPKLLSPNTPTIFIRSKTQLGTLNIQQG